MSRENVELAQEGYARLNDTYETGDLQPWRRYIEEAFRPELVVEGESAFTEGVWRGHEGLVEFTTNQMEVLEGMWIRPEEFIDVDDDRLVVCLSLGGRARHTGIDVELTVVHVVTVRDGKWTRVQMFESKAEALEAVRLSE
jgi:ketosteroid isomerase-like protein